MSDISIFVGSVYGSAEQTAEQVKAALEREGISSQIFLQADLDSFKQAKAILVLPLGRVIFLTISNL